MHNFKKLDVWKKSLVLVTSIYKISAGFPYDEKFGITSQLRRAAVSIPSNIAEGSGKRTGREFQRFLEIANGSAFEVENLLLISASLGFLSAADAQKYILDIEEIQKMIYGLIKNLNNYVAEPEIDYLVKSDNLDYLNNDSLDT